jgi:hypothetical protein
MPKWQVMPKRRAGIEGSEPGPSRVNLHPSLCITLSTSHPHTCTQGIALASDPSYKVLSAAYPWVSSEGVGLDQWGSTRVRAKKVGEGGGFDPSWTARDQQAFFPLLSQPPLLLLPAFVHSP